MGKAFSHVTALDASAVRISRDVLSNGETCIKLEALDEYSTSIACIHVLGLPAEEIDRVAPAASVPEAAS